MGQKLIDVEERKAEGNQAQITPMAVNPLRGSASKAAPQECGK